MDLRRFHAFQKHVIVDQLDLEDLDQGGPHSRTSTAWELSFALEGCPSAWEGITRII